MAEFKHFSPIGEVTAKKLYPNFTGNLDLTSAKGLEKNFGRLEEIAANAGAHLAKNVILKNTLGFFSPKEADKRADPEFKQPSGETMTVLGHNELGFPVFSNLVIKADQYIDDVGNVIASFTEIRIDAVIMEVNRSNKVVITEIPGRNRDIIERIASNSPRIKIYGTIFSDTPGVYPIDAVSNLARALDSNKALVIDSWYLQMMGIYNLVVLKSAIKQEIGSQEYQKFEFDAIADAPLVLRLTPTR